MIHNRLIWHVTLMGYITQVTALHIQYGIPNPHPTDTDWVKIITGTMKNYKMVPDHWEIIRDVMFHHMVMVASRKIPLPISPTSQLPNTTGHFSAAMLAFARGNGVTNTRHPLTPLVTLCRASGPRHCLLLLKTSPSLMPLGGQYLFYMNSGPRVSPISTSTMWNYILESKKQW